MSLDSNARFEILAGTPGARYSRQLFPEIVGALPSVPEEVACESYLSLWRISFVRGKIQVLKVDTRRNVCKEGTIGRGIGGSCGRCLTSGIGSSSSWGSAWARRSAAHRKVE